MAAAVGRRGFSLIEMLVVISLIVVMMGISAASFVSTPRHNGLLGAELMLANAIRQARQTARSQGSAVVLTLDRTDGTVAGLSRLVLWSESFNGAVGNAPGLAGSGFHILDDPANPGTVLRPTPHLLEPRNLPVRGGRALGFRLACAALVPPQETGPGTIPLVLVGPDDHYEQSVAGLYLVKTTRTMIEDEVGANNSRMPAPFSTYELVGWLRVAGTPAPFEVSTGERTQAPGSITRTGESALMHASVQPTGDPNQGYDIATPINGGRWEQFALVFDGRSKLTLERGGRRVAEYTFDATTTPVPDVIAPTNIQFGIVTIRDASGNPTTYYARGTTIDDVRWERLGTDRAGRLPPGITVDSDCVITCHGDGHVDLFKVTTGGSVPADIIELTGTGGKKSWVKIAANGGTSSSMIAPGAGP